MLRRTKNEARIRSILLFIFFCAILGHSGVQSPIAATRRLDAEELGRGCSRYGKMLLVRAVRAGESAAAVRNLGISACACSARLELFRSEARRNIVRIRVTGRNPYVDQ